jgi:preprotein translocase subunit SecF
MITNVIPLNAGKGIGFGTGLDYGLDFAGGTQLQLKLEKPISSEISYRKNWSKIIWSRTRQPRRGRSLELGRLVAYHWSRSPRPV